MTGKKKFEESTAIDFKAIAIALTGRTIDTLRLARKAGDLDYIQSLSEYTVSDLVVNTSDGLEGESCLDRVGTVLEIRDREVEILCLDGVGHAVVSPSSTYLAAKGGRND